MTQVESNTNFFLNLHHDFLRDTANGMDDLVLVDHGNLRTVNRAILAQPPFP